VQVVIEDRDEQCAELREQLMRYQVLERETTDPVASVLLHDIVSELERSLRAMDRADR
jgi:hypothetical protein